MPIKLLALLATLTFTAASSGPLAAPSPRGLYSAKALKRARLLLQMRLLELHARRLACLRAAIERALSLALPAELPAAVAPEGAPTDPVKQTGAPLAITRQRVLYHESEVCGL
jgi:hypothetical protein